jgi:hypothetical protein
MADPTTTRTEFDFHPYANIFPLMEGDEFKRFKDDLRTKKQQEPIVMFEGKILDGRNRFNACKDLGLTPATKPYEGSDPLGFVLSANLHRRHLNESQRAMVAAKLVTTKLGDNQHAKGKPIDQPSAAKMLNVSAKSVQRAKDVLDKAVPELVKAVEQNKVKVSAAAKKLAIKSAEEQKKIVADPKLLAKELKPPEVKPLDRLEKAWDKEEHATQQAFVEARYQDLKKLMKAVEEKAKAEKAKA